MPCDPAMPVNIPFSIYIVNYLMLQKLCVARPEDPSLRGRVPGSDPRPDGPGTGSIERDDEAGESAAESTAETQSVSAEVRSEGELGSEYDPNDQQVEGE